MEFSRCSAPGLVPIDGSYSPSRPFKLLEHWLSRNWNGMPDTTIDITYADFNDHTAHVLLASNPSESQVCSCGLECSQRELELAGILVCSIAYAII
jgi:hypothetical protein